MKDGAPIIIIKKRRKPELHGSHGGSWKIAYADFVTAMMAFFLLMWLINVINEDQRKGIADYFSTNYINMQTRNGSSGMLAGKNVTNENNSNGKSSQERAKSNDPKADVTKSKQYEEFENKREVSNDILDYQSDVKIEKTNSEKIKKNDVLKIIETAINQNTPEKTKKQITHSEKDSKEKTPGQARTGEKKGQKEKDNTVQNDKMNDKIVDQKQNEQKQQTNQKETQESIQQKSQAITHTAVNEENQHASKDTQIATNAQSVSNIQAVTITKIETKKSTFAHPSMIDLKKQDIKNEVDKKIEEKTLKNRALEKEAEAKALNQLLKDIKKENSNTTYQRSIDQALSDKTKEQQKNEKDKAESKEKKDLLKQLQNEEQEKLNKVSSSILEMVKKNSELKGLVSNIIIENRPEGLRIQLIDKNQHAMFASGSSSMTPSTMSLLKVVADLIAPLSNAIIISGHTDAHPFIGSRKYTNWELSADRANATRRILSDYKIEGKRFESVMGKEATDPFIKEDPFNESNRRISITLLREYGAPDSDALKQVVGG